MLVTLRRRRLLTVVLATLALLVPSALLGAPAGAATQSVTFTVTGTISVGPPPALTIPSGSTITFDHDPLTGAITNAVANIPTFDRGPVQGPQANITLQTAQPGSGTWDRTTGAGTIALSLSGSIEVPFLSATCDLSAPLELALSTANPGGQPVVGSPASGVVTAAGFTIPSVAGVVPTGLAPALEPPPCVLVDDFLGLPTADTTASFAVTEQVPEPDPTPDPTPVPAPVPVRPTFTG